MADAVNLGSIYADLDLNTGNLDRGLAGARVAMDAIGQEVQRLQREFKAGAIGLQSYSDRMAALTAESSRLKSAMFDAYTANNQVNSGLGVFNATAKGAAGNAGILGRGMMQLGYVIDDLQYSFMAAVNNIAPLAQAFGASQGLAGALQIAGISAISLYKQWDELREAFGDTSPQEEAMRSLDGMSAKLKKLQADAQGFGWGDSLAWMFGLNPDAGKAGQAANLEFGVKARTKAEENAKTMEGDHTDEEKAAAERFKDAVIETGGVDKHAGQLGADMVKQKGAREFLSVERTMGGLGGSQRDKYEALSGRKDLSDAERSRKSDLEELARQAAVKRAREQIGMALHDPDAQKAIGDRVGGAAGDMLAGRTKTAKQTTKDIDADSDAADVVLKDSTDAMKAGRMAEQKKAREAKAEDAREEAEYKKRLKEAKDKAEEVIPGLKDRTELATARAMVQGVPMDAVSDQIAAALKGTMEPDIAIEVADGLVKDAKKTVGDKVEKEKMDPRINEAKQEKPRNSETLDTASLTARAQSAVKSGVESESKKHTTQLGEVIDKLSKLVDRKTIEIEVKD